MYVHYRMNFLRLFWILFFFRDVEEGASIGKRHNKATAKFTEENKPYFTSTMELQSTKQRRDYFREGATGYIHTTRSRWLDRCQNPGRNSRSCPRSAFYASERQWKLQRRLSSPCKQARAGHNGDDSNGKGLINLMKNWQTNKKWKKKYFAHTHLI